MGSSSSFLKAAVLLGAVSLLVVYVRSAQMQAEAVRAELAELKELVRQSHAREVTPVPAMVGSMSITPPAAGTSSLSSVVTLDRPKPLINPYETVPPDEPRHPQTFLASSKSAVVFGPLVTPPSALPELYLPRGEATADTMNPVRDSGLAERSQRTFMMSSKSFSMAPEQSMSLLQRLLRLGWPHSGVTSLEGIGRTQTGLSPQDLKRVPVIITVPAEQLGRSSSAP